MTRSQRWINIGAVTVVIVAFALIFTRNIQGKTDNQLLNVSYDPTRELYQKLNAEFVTDYQRRTGRRVSVVQSHGGSSRQARKVIDGEESADVVTLGIFTDVDALRKRGLIASDWADRLPNHSLPYTSTIVFVVRRNNPKNIHDWSDLVRPGVQIITPNPKTSSNGKLSVLAAWGAIVTRGGSETQARAYLKAFYQHLAETDPGARTAAMTFTLREIGDVQLAWENEAIREVSDSNGRLQIVYPPVSILAEPYVAWVDVNVARRATTSLARDYLEFLFTDQAQQTIESLGYRPYKENRGISSTTHLPKITLFPITAVASNWSEAQQKFFGENGIIDSVSGSTQ